MTCPEYLKTDTLYMRDDNHVITNVIRRPEFLVPAKWLVTEKIDGTNIRISLEPETIAVDNDGEWPTEGETKWIMVIRGRTSKAQIPTLLFEHLQKTFTAEKLKALWRCKSNCEECRGESWTDNTDEGRVFCPKLESYPITLYGEGYGDGIQKGGGQYTSKTKGGAASFRLFDVFIGETWLDRENVEDIAGKLGIKTVPLLGTTWNIDSIVELVRSGFRSDVAEEEGESGHEAEGIMAFTSPPLFNSRGKRLMFKLKTRDFEGVPSYTRTDTPPSVSLSKSAGAGAS